MADTPDMELLARQYMDLWQQQLTDMAADPALARTMAQTMELMNAGAGSFTTLMQQAMDGTAKGQKDHDGGSASQTDAPQTDGAATDAVASGDLEQRVDELTRRLAVLEDRLADVDAKPKAAGGTAKRGPGKRRP